MIILQDWFLEFHIKLYDKNSESDYFFLPPPKSEYFFQQHWESEYFFRTTVYISSQEGTGGICLLGDIVNMFVPT
jgi:hypothetical protein